MCTPGTSVCYQFNSLNWLSTKSDECQGLRKEEHQYEGGLAHLWQQLAIRTHQLAENHNFKEVRKQHKPEEWVTRKEECLKASKNS